MQIQEEFGVNLSLLGTEPNRIGQAEEKNCEQMFGSVPIPVGYAGPLKMTFSSGDTDAISLPLATTEGALVASVNRGCKALSEADVKTSVIYHGISRSIAFGMKKSRNVEMLKLINEKEAQWNSIGEATSSHLKILSHDIDESDDYVFLTINGDTDEAMGMNMITIAAQEIGNWIAKEAEVELITIAANVDSDKKPSQRTHDKGRGYEVTAEVILNDDVITSVLKSKPEAMLEVYEAKLKTGSKLAGAIGSNLHAANVIAALYLATGQDAAHTIEGSLTDTTFERISDTESKVTVRLPAVLVGTVGGGTALPAQSQCLDLLLKPTTSLSRVQQLAESIGAAVLAGEVSLLAAQAAHQLASSHKKLAR
jgi:hydroxymethylglutaryl-CoA reductase (NADPH)